MRQDGEDGADGDVDIDVRRAIEWVEQHQVFALCMGGHKFVFFFRSQTCHMGIVLQGINQHVVGNHIQFLLVLALHIVAARFTDDACQVAQAHFVADGHA